MRRSVISQKLGYGALAMLTLMTLGVASCGDDDGLTPVDAGSDASVDAEPPDAAVGACREIGEPSYLVDTLPARLDGDLGGGGADLVSPPVCDVVNAPLGTESAGVDRVVALTGLEIGRTYVVRLDAEEDLAFYVVSGCSTPTGPAIDECLLFVDAFVHDPEIGQFTAEGETAWIVVDVFGGVVSAGGFALDVYAADCTTDDECSGDTPACLDARCVECATGFDCPSTSAPACDEVTHTCRAGYASCNDDDPAPAENADDGPAGATLLAPADGQIIGVTGRICDAPVEERDWYRFDVGAGGEDWILQLLWNSSVDLDLEVHDASGDIIGMSFWERPETIELTYLPAGTYYISVDYFASTQTTAVVPYALDIGRTTVPSCTSTADCAFEWRNQVYRGDCQAGACVSIDGDGALGAGEACDSRSDCAAGTVCGSFFFTADADTRDVCGLRCDQDSQCASMGADYVCTTYLVQNFCVPRCETTAHCPALPTAIPSVPPWSRLGCQTSTGRCLP